MTTHFLEKSNPDSKCASTSLSEPAGSISTIDCSPLNSGFRSSSIRASSALRLLSSTRDASPTANRITDTSNRKIPISRNVIAIPSADFRRGVEQAARQIDARRPQPLHEFRIHSGRAETPLHLPVRRQPRLLEREDVLEGYLLAFHSHALGHVRHSPRAVAHARDLQKYVHRRRDLLPDRPHPDVRVRHRHHHFHAA